MLVIFYFIFQNKKKNAYAKTLESTEEGKKNRHTNILVIGDIKPII